MTTRPRSLRIAVQTSSLIAVLAGYGLLLALAGGLGVFERREAHRQLVASLTDALQAGQGRAVDLSGFHAMGLQASLVPVDQRGSSTQLKAMVVAGLTGQPDFLTDSGHRHWLQSRSQVRLASGGIGVLTVRQNVTASIERQRTLLLLLLAAAGVASLFTSALLRLVLHRHLVQPIEALCQQLQVIGAPQIPELPSLLDSGQPRELQPIAIAFDALQHRLAESWGRERSFTDGVAHELRTPITLISGQAQSLLRQPMNQEALATVRAIGRESHYMGDLVRHLLDLSRQDAGRLQLLLERFDSEALILEAFDRLRPLNPERLFLAPVVGTEPMPLLADRERLMQCISALVDNALAYSSGPVELSLTSIEHSAVLVLHVADRGPGVLMEERQKIFERFERGSAAALAPDQRGSGLGLALVTLLMEAMGGVVIVEDRPGGGADFQLCLPINDHHLPHSG
jgi:two-component system OmpR family sensor kinase